MPTSHFPPPQSSGPRPQAAPRSAGGTAKKKLLVAAAIVLAGAAGWGLPTLVNRLGENRRLERDYAARAKSLPAFLTLLREDPQLRSGWQRVVGAKLEAALAAPWNETSDDFAWGRAFAVLRDGSRERWACDPGAPEASQDELVRYLCFRVEAFSTWAGGDRDNLASEFGALESYPDKVLIRHRLKLARAVETAMYSPYVRQVFRAQDFLAAKAGQPWAAQASWRYLSNYQSLNAHPLENFLRRLGLVAKAGNQGARVLLARLIEEAKDHPPNMSAEDRVVFDRCLKALGEKPAAPAVPTTPPRR